MATDDNEDADDDDDDDFLFCEDAESESAALIAAHSLDHAGSASLALIAAHSSLSRTHCRSKVDSLTLCLSVAALDLGLGLIGGLSLQVLLLQAVEDLTHLTFRGPQDCLQLIESVHAGHVTSLTTQFQVGLIVLVAPPHMLNPHALIEEKPGSAAERLLCHLNGLTDVHKELIVPHALLIVPKALKMPLGGLKAKWETGYNERLVITRAGYNEGLTRQKPRTTNTKVSRNGSVFGKTSNEQRERGFSITRFSTRITNEKRSSSTTKSAAQRA